MEEKKGTAHFVSRGLDFDFQGPSAPNAQHEKTESVELRGPVFPHSRA